MCNGSSTRSSQGGTLAILRPLLSSPPSSTPNDLSLRLVSNPAQTSTIATIDGLESRTTNGEGSDEERFFVIHRDGDLRTSGIDETSILHCLTVPDVAAREGGSFALERRLDLGVGGEGVIGRRVSFVVGRRVVGQGVMGWN